MNPHLYVLQSEKLNKAARIVSVFVLLVCGLTKTTAQISDSLYNIIPDSLKPADKDCVSLIDKSRILGEAYFFVNGDFGGELEFLAALLAEETRHEKNRADRLFSWDALSIFYVNNLGSDANAIKYADIFLREAGNDPEYEKNKAQVLARKAYCLNNLERKYEESTDILISTIPLSAKYKDSANLVLIYSSLGFSCFYLELLEDAIRYFDQGIIYAGNDLNYRIILATNKIKVYLTLYQTTNNKVYGDKAESEIRKIMAGKEEENTKWISYCYTFLAWKSYIEKDYTRAIAYTDSTVFKKYIDADYSPETTIYVNSLYKGMSLLHTSDENKGAELLKNLKIGVGQHTNINYRTVSYSMLELYNWAKKNRNWKDALDYYERYKSAKEAQDIMTNRGKVFEVNQKYAVAEKETEVKTLEKKNILKEKQLNQTVLAAVIIGLMLLIGLLVFYIRNRRQLIKRLVAEKMVLEEKQKHEQDLILQEAKLQTEMNEAVIAQRRKISGDMHDDFSGSLAALRFYIADVKTTVKDEDARLLFDDIESEVGSIYHNARLYMHNLSKNIMENQYNIIDLLSDLEVKIASKTSLAFHTEIDQEKAKSLLTIDQHYHLYHIIREAISNTIKYAHASSVDIRILFTEDNCVFSITDNGIGFDKEKNQWGIGLQNLNDRIKTLRGKLEIETGTRGTTLNGYFPLDKFFLG